MNPLRPLEFVSEALSRLTTLPRPVLQPFSFNFISFSPLQCEPNRFQQLRIVIITRKEMPMKMGNLIAKQFVIQLARAKDSLNRFGQQAHFIEISDPLVLRQLVELRGMMSRDQDAVALVILPWTEQSDRVRKLPD